MAAQLFSNEEASDPGCPNVRDGSDRRLKLAKWHCEYLWMRFRPHADNEFRTEIRRTFDVRYWEMYLTTSLIFAGFDVTCPKPGPDVGGFGSKLWHPTAGIRASPIPSRQRPTDLCRRKKSFCVIGISTKYKDQYLKWLANGTVSEKDAMVCAINPWAIPFDHTDGDPPRILEIGYTIGPPNASVDVKDMKIVGSGYEFRGFVQKAPRENDTEGEKIATGIFQQAGYSWLSGLLCPRAEALNRPPVMGGDFQLAPNLNATVKLPDRFRLRGTYYETKRIESGYQVTPTFLREARLC